MNILVTGGLGVNGAWVVRRLVGLGHSCVVIDTRADTSLISDVVADVTVIAADAADRAALLDVMRAEGIERVVHMAGMVTGMQEDPFSAVRVNVMGTLQVLEAARVAGVDRVVFTSSRAVYGDMEGEFGAPTYRAVGEDDPLRPKLVYDVTKAAAEGMGQNFSRQFGVEFTALRFSHILAPGKPARHGGFSVASRMIEDSYTGRPVRIDRGDDQRDDVIYVADAAEGIVSATLSKQALQYAYNISRGVTTTLADLADAVRHVLPEADIEIGPGMDYQQLGANYYGALDNRRALEDLGFSPRFDLASAVADYVSQLERLNLV